MKENLAIVLNFPSKYITEIITSVNIIVQPVVSGEGDTQDDEAYQRKHQPKPNVPKPPGAPVQTETVVAIHHRDHLK